jgi:hypothetical protein
VYLTNLQTFLGSGASGVAKAADSSPEVAQVYTRRAEPKGPMVGFGYNYLDDKTAQRKIAKPALLERQGLWGDGSLYAYEALNLVDGKRTVGEIRDALAAIYGPVPVSEVAEMLTVLARIGVIEKR